LLQFFDYLSSVLAVLNVKSFRKTVYGLLGHDRRERRGTYLLSLLLIMLLIFRFVAFRVPEAGEVSDEMAAAVTAVAQGADADRILPELFTFDPNTSSFDELLQLGLTERQAATLVSYRNSGARFRRPEDIGRVYGIDSSDAARLIPYIVIADGRERSDAVAEGKRTPQGSDERLPGSRHPSSSGRADDYTGAADLPAPGYSDSEPGRWNSLSGVRAARRDGTSDLRAAGYSDRYSVGEKPMIDLNICTAAELEQLPGIGPVLSERIIRYRALLGGFVAREQLGEVYGIDSTVARLVAGRVTLTFEAVRPLLLDSTSFGSLARHPYVGYETARLIEAYRSLAEAPLTLGSLVEERVISPLQAARLAPYVRPPEEVAGEDYEFILSKVLK
jgi:DNA uptake protein ComE-like DNA-binding protein